MAVMATVKKRFATFIQTSYWLMGLFKQTLQI
jgi:hypothetical protein